MKILVTGSGGMMGWGIRRVFTDDLILTTHDDFNVQNVNIIKTNFMPDIIFHLAAETDHHRAELNPSNTYMVNHTGTMNVVELARRFDIPIVYIGTCGIFDGSKESYLEHDTPCPLNHYGRSKYYGELAVRSYAKHYIVRCGWSMGGGVFLDKKFVGLIYGQIRRGSGTIFAINDVYGSPTYTPDFARTLQNIIRHGDYGTYNVAGVGRASRYDIAVEFCKHLGKKVQVFPMTYVDYHNKFGLKVPYTKCEVLNIDKINLEGLSDMRPWREALAEYVKECFI